MGKLTHARKIEGEMLIRRMSEKAQQAYYGIGSFLVYADDRNSTEDIDLFAVDGTKNMSFDELERYLEDWKAAMDERLREYEEDEDDDEDEKDDMDVYIVARDYYIEHEAAFSVEGVFSTYQKAEKAIEKYAQGSKELSNEYYIIKREVDEEDE